MIDTTDSVPAIGGHIVDAHVLLLRGTDVLLLRRRDPDPTFDGRWHLPSGKVELGESVLAAAVREAREEVGIRLVPAGLRHVHTLHVLGSGPHSRLGVFFATNRWAGDPVNQEPAKCSALRWFPLRSLPDDVIEYPAAGITAYRRGQPFGQLGWPEHPPDPGGPARAGGRA